MAWVFYNPSFFLEVKNKRNFKIRALFDVSGKFSKVHLANQLHSRFIFAKSSKEFTFVLKLIQMVSFDIKSKKLSEK